MTKEEIQKIIKRELKPETKRLLKVVDKRIDDKIGHYTGVIIEEMNGRFKAVAEANQGTNERLDRFEMKTDENFDQVNRRLIHVETDVTIIKQALIVRRILDEKDQEDE